MGGELFKPGGDKIGDPEPEDIKSGLDKVAGLSAGSGWVNLNAQASSSSSFSANLDAGLKLTPDWAAYGRVWGNSDKEFGAQAGLRLNNSLDVYAAAQGKVGGATQATAGLTWHF